MTLSASDTAGRRSGGRGRAVPLDGGMPPRSTAAGVAAVSRALLVLGAFRPGDSALPLRVLAARTGLYKSTILRLLASLERSGAVLREPDSSWSPGPMLFHWGLLYLRGVGLEARGVPLAEGLSEDTGGIAAFWARLDAERRICVFRALPPRSPRQALSPGDVMPMGTHATAQVFAAWENRADGATMTKDARPEVVVSPGTRDGDPTSLSAPVFGSQGRLVGALTLSGAGDRFLGEVDRARGLLADAAATLMRSVGA